MTEDCYAYVRKHYGVEAYIGKRVRFASKGGREGVLVNRRTGDQYIYVWLDGDEKVTGPYHPTDGVEYLSIHPRRGAMI